MKKNNKKEKAKFFCESCGVEVNQNARVCTNCGKFFSSVRCPNCGKTGRTEEFIHGCPDCGYAVSGSNINHKNSVNNQNQFINSLLGKYLSNSNNANVSNDTRLPFWIYIICIFVLITLVIVLYSCL